MTTATRYPDPPVRHPPRPLATVLADIRANVEAQEVARQAHQPERVYELQEKQKALFVEKRYAEWQARGVEPHIIRNE